MDKDLSLWGNTVAAREAQEWRDRKPEHGFQRPMTARDDSALCRKCYRPVDQHSEKN
jgi:hypothetical protein